MAKITNEKLLKEIKKLSDEVAVLSTLVMQTQRYFLSRGYPYYNPYGYQYWSGSIASLSTQTTSTSSGISQCL